MGIHGFYYNFLKKNNLFKYNVIKRHIPYGQNVCSLLIDFNGIIHQTSGQVYATADADTILRMNPESRAAHEARVNDLKNLANFHISQGTFDQWMMDLQNQHFQAITIRLKELLSAIKPTQLLVISIDGPAPLAKLLQQRSRRYRSAKQRDQRTKAAGQPYHWPLFNSNSITPGTQFMINLDNYLKNWILNNGLILPSEIIYYSHLTKGEGEHNIMDLIRSGRPQTNCPDGGIHVLYGSDSDLAMLGLIAPIKNMFIARDNLTDIIDIDAFQSAVKQMMGQGDSSLADFVLLFFLVGNDFLPKPPTMENIDESVDRLITIYRQNGLSLTANGGSEVNWPGVFALLKKIGQNEPHVVNHIANARQPKYPSRAIQFATSTTQFPSTSGFRGGTKGSCREVDFNKYRMFWYSNALRPKQCKCSATEQGYLDKFPGVDVDVITQMVLRYLQGIGWVNYYYHKGQASINVEWYYPWEYAPLFTDVANIINQMENTGTPVPDYQSRPGQNGFHVLEQLLAVLPPSDKDLVPDSVRYLMEPLSVLTDLYPIDFMSDVDGKNAEWQAIPLLPFFQPQRIRDQVNLTTFSQDEILMYDLQRKKQGSIFSNPASQIRARSRSIQNNVQGRSQAYHSGRGRQFGRGQSRSQSHGQSRGQSRSQSRGQSRGQSSSKSRGQSQTVAIPRARPSTRPSRRPRQTPVPVSQQSDVSSPVPVSQQSDVSSPVPIAQQSDVSSPVPIAQQSDVSSPVPIAQQSSAPHSIQSSTSARMEQTVGSRSIGGMMKKLIRN